MTSLIPVVRGKETSHMTILSQLKESWLEYLKIFKTYMKPYKSYSVTHSNIAFCFKIYTFASKCTIGLFLPVNCSYLLPAKTKLMRHLFNKDGHLTHKSRSAAR